MARKALKPPAVFLMGAATNLALRHQPSNQIFYWYLLRTHLGSTGFGINLGWRGPRDSALGSLGLAGPVPRLGAVPGRLGRRAAETRPRPRLEEHRCLPRGLPLKRPHLRGAKKRSSLPSASGRRDLRGRPLHLSNTGRSPPYDFEV